MHRFKEAGGCEAEMMFVRRRDFNQVSRVSTYVEGYHALSRYFAT